MSDDCDVQVKTMPEQAVPPIAPNQAISFVARYEFVRKLVERFPSPKRPNRNRPIHHPNLKAELEAWDAASDEALENTERDLME